jgi:hypothetical protein
MVPEVGSHSRSCWFSAALDEGGWRCSAGNDKPFREREERVFLQGLTPDQATELIRFLSTDGVGSIMRDVREGLLMQFLHRERS